MQELYMKQLYEKDFTENKKILTIIQTVLEANEP